MDRHSQLLDAQQLIRQRWRGNPRFGVILGTGANNVAADIVAESVIPYAEIPGFPRSTALGHKGQLVCGQLAGHEVVAMQGRFHLYEGYSNRQIQFPLELMKWMGVEVLFISNAAGGVNPDFESGELMVLESHLDLMFRDWRVGDRSWNEHRPGIRADCYDRILIEGALRHARGQGFVLQRGVYAGLTGPNYETRAEYRFLGKLGADVVGMSTVPEVVFAGGLGMRVLAFSIVANMALPDALEETSGKQVIDAAETAAPRLCSLVVNAMHQTS